MFYPKALGRPELSDYQSDNTEDYNDSEDSEGDQSAQRDTDANNVNVPKTYTASKVAKNVYYTKTVKTGENVTLLCDLAKTSRKNIAFLFIILAFDLIISNSN